MRGRARAGVRFRVRVKVRVATSWYPLHDEDSVYISSGAAIRAATLPVCAYARVLALWLALGLGFALRLGLVCTSAPVYQ